MKKKLLQLIPMLMFMVIGGVCGAFMADHLDEILGTGIPLPLRILKLVWLVLCLYGGSMLQILIHESGHLVLGLMTGYHFSSFRVFSFMFVKENGKISRKRLSLAGTGGQCLMAPPELVDGSMPVLLYNAGGVIFNILSGATFWGCALLLKRIPMIAIFFKVLAVLGIGYAIVNGVPMHTGNVSNDGYNMFSLGKDKVAIRAFWIQMKTNEEISKGKRLFEMPDEWFEMPSKEARKNEMAATLAVFHCNRLMDQQKFEEAKEAIEMLLSEENGMAELHRSLLRCDLITLKALLKEEPDGSWKDKTLIRFMKTMKNFPSVLRTQYVYELLVNGDEEAAEKRRQQFEEMGVKYPYASDLQSEREIMDAAAAKVDKKS